MRKTFWLSSLILLFISCGSEVADKSEIKVFHYNQPQKITSLDPAFAKSQNNMWPVHHMYNTLISLDKNLVLQPELAKNFQISEDGMRYKFTLQDSVYFHDAPCFSEKSDRLLTADDVVFSFNRIIDNTLNSPGSWIFKGKVSDVNPFQAVDDSTVVVQLKEPFLPMLNILTMQYCSIVSEKAVEFYGDQIRENPVGTGPFRFKRWIENQGLFLIKNEEYYKGDVALDGVRTSFMEDRKVAFIELLNRKLEFVNGLESSFINEMLDREGELQEKHQENLNFYKSPYLNFEYLGFNMEGLESYPALQDVRVRQALNYAIDRETMLASLRNNIGSPADSGVIPKGLPSYNSDQVQGYKYDLGKARLLLAEAGYNNGDGINKLTIQTNRDYLDITTFVAKQWEKLGIQTSIQLLESASLREGMRKGSIDIFRASWIADYPDGENFLSMFYSGNPAPPRYTRFSNEKYDRLYEQAIAETNLSNRTELYHEMNRILVAEAPLIFLFYDQSSWFVSKNIEGIETNALNLLNVAQLKEI